MFFLGGGHWYPCFGFLVTFPLGFQVRVGSARRQTHYHCASDAAMYFSLIVSISFSKSAINVYIRDQGAKQSNIFF